MKDVKLTEEYIEEMIFNGVWRVHEGITTVKKEAKYLTKKMLEVRKLLIESHLPQVSNNEAEASSEGVAVYCSCEDKYISRIETERVTYCQCGKIIKQ